MKSYNQAVALRAQAAGELPLVCTQGLMLPALPCFIGTPVFTRTASATSTTSGTSHYDHTLAGHDWQPHKIVQQHLASDQTPVKSHTFGGQGALTNVLACIQEMRVEELMEKAVAQSERPWLVLLTTVSCISAALLTLILLRLQQGGHL